MLRYYQAGSYLLEMAWGMEREVGSGTGCGVVLRLMGVEEKGRAVAEPSGLHEGRVGQILPNCLALPCVKQMRRTSLFSPV
jgi:hypothetical protein